MLFYEVLTFGFVTLAAVLLAKFLAGIWGLVGLVVLIPVGLYWVWLIRTAFRTSWAQFRTKIDKLPDCRHVRCRSEDYIVLETRADSTVYRCRCGDTYLRQGSYFSIITPIGAIQPYMKSTRTGVWVRDTTT